MQLPVYVLLFFVSHFSDLNGNPINGSGPVVSAAFSLLKEDSLTIQMDQINIWYCFGETQPREKGFEPLA